MPNYLNQKVLISGADYFRVVDLNPYTHAIDAADRKKVMSEHAGIAAALKEAGIEVIKIDAPRDCYDGIFTANWAFCYGNTAVMSSLPGPRKKEESSAEQALQHQGKRIIKVPHRFSGQGDTLRCGKYLFTASGYRTDERMPQFLAETFPDLEVISLKTVPQLDESGSPVINQLSGWPDSYFYDVDLALSVLQEELIGWCPEAFTPESQEKIRKLPIRKIEVSLSEAIDGLGCNLISTGETVIMSRGAPLYKAAIEACGLTVTTPDTSELAKGGGGIRCIALTLA